MTNEERAITSSASTTKGKEMMTFSVQFPMLSATNYTVWAMRMKVALKVHKVWGVIDSGDSDPEKNDLATALLFQTIPEMLILKIGKQDTAKGLWNAIKTRHMGGKLFRKGPRWKIDWLIVHPNPNSMEDFSGPIKPIKESVCIFWDVEDYPFPAASSPDLIYKKIFQVIHELISISSILSIWAYVDEKNESWTQFLGAKTWNSRIYFIPAGDKEARVNRMYHDICLCKMDLYRCYPELIVLADQNGSNSSFYSMLREIGEDIEEMGVSFYLESNKDYDPEKSDWPNDVFFGDWDHCS